MVDFAANMLLETLRDLLVDEVMFLSGVSHEVKKVEADLRIIHALLMEADNKKGRSDSPTFRKCIDELKELAFKAENILEKYAFEVESKKQGKSLKENLQRFMCILSECCKIHEVGNEIDDIRSQLADLTSKLSSISGGVEASSNSAHEEQRRLSRLRYAHEVEQHFVGMEKDIEYVVSMVKHNYSPPFISVCGMGGLGKTTLARKIYHHQEIQRFFDGLAWVCATQQFQAETVLREIFEKIDGSKADMGLAALVEGLHNALMKKKCLIVIDDIWETHHWEILKPAFPTKNCKVVLTTRNEKIASQEGHVYKLDFLSEDEGWELLARIALPINVLESGSKSFKYIGRQIVQKCGRLPLAISVIGGVLRRKQQILVEWEEVSSNIDSYLRHEGEGIGNVTRVKLVLDLSYDVLPYYLKPCFLYLACFPEDQDIDTELLYKLWLAEGLISIEEKGNHETLRDVAERYLTELAFRCMVQVEKGDLNFPYTRFESCRLHDLMRDLCSSKAKVEKFVKRVDISRQGQKIRSPFEASIHRLAINPEYHSDDHRRDIVKQICMDGLKDLRSFLFLSKYQFRMSATNLENIFNFRNSKHLRILVVNNVEFENGNLPSTIGEQRYLKYLSLYKCKVKEVQQIVWNFPYMQTLDLRVYCSMKMPNVIWKMKRLRHLFLPSCLEVIGGDKLKLDGLNELETLDTIESKSVCIADVINLTNLRTLVVRIEDDMDSLSKIVDYMSSNVCQLRDTHLYIESCDLRNVLKKLLMSRSLTGMTIGNCEDECSFPSYEEGMCPHLVILRISNSKIEGDLMEVLGDFPLLQHLWLEGEFKEAMMNKMRFGVNSFSQLKYLYLMRLKNLQKWEVEKGAMPKLRELYLHNCTNLEKLPDALRFISTLESLECYGMSEKFKDRMRRGENGQSGGKDYANFSHISRFQIR